VRRPSVSQFLRDHHVDETPINKENRMPPSKYGLTKLPTIAEAIELVEKNEEWGKTAKSKDMHAAAQQFELMALLLQFYINGRGGES